VLSTGIALLLALTSTAATPRAVIVALSPESSLTPAQRSEIEAALTVRGYQGIDEVDAAALRHAARSQPAAEAPQALYIEAKKALMNFDDAAARQKLERARALLCESPRILSERILLADTHLLAGMIAMSSGQPDQAERDFTLAALLEPTRSLHPGLYPPDVVDAFEAAKRRPAERPRGALVVNARPAGAQIYVDGAFRGAAPLVVERLAAGPHYVTAIVAGRGARTRVVEVASGHSTPLSLFVPDQGGAPLVELVAGYRAGPDDSARAEALLEGLGADLLLAFGQRRSAAALRADDGELLLHLLPAERYGGDDLGDRAALLIEEVEAAHRARTAPQVASSAPALGPTVAASVPAEIPAGSARDDEPLSPWAWVAIGGGGVAVITAITIGIIALVTSWPDPPAPEERARIVW
jgi:hypothetical protein